MAYELAVYLASRGNEVHFITTKPGEVMREHPKGNLLIKYYPMIDHPFFSRFNVEYWQTFALTCIKALLKERYDLVYTCLTMDACAAGLNKAIRGTPFVPLLITGEPLYRDAPRAKRLFRMALKKASRLVTISHYVNEILKRDFGLDGVMIPCPVDTSKFFYTEKKETDFPRILCTATLAMERKRVPLLVKAFEILVQHYPNAILQLAGETTPQITQNLLMSVHSKARRSIELLDITSDKVLGAYYRNATISVLPSLKEAFGMVSTESLASGTPVVATRSGGTPEILDDPRVGVLFEPTDGPDELCRALIKGIELAQDPQISRRCSQHAERYSWDTLGPKYEDLQREVLAGIRKAARPPKKAYTKKISSTDLSDRPALFNGQSDKRVLNKFFVDTLDALEITSSMYYGIESRKPRYLHFLEWILNKAKHHDSVLVMSLDPHFLTLLLKECGIEAKQVLIRPGLEVGRQTRLSGIGPDAQELGKIIGNFDIIVCDDLLQYWTSPLQCIQALKNCLNPDGTLLLSTQNVTSVESRMRLFAGRNIYPWFDNSNLNGDSARNGERFSFYREYTLGEVNELVSRAGFALIEKRCIVGKNNIHKSVNFVSILVKAYLLHKIDHQIQRFVGPLRSHLFVAAINALPGDKLRKDRMEG